MKKAFAKKSIRRPRTESPWILSALEALRSELVHYGWSDAFTSEQVMERLSTYYSIERPTNPNDVGAMINAAKNLGMIRQSKKFFASTRPEAHGRMLRGWMVNRSKLSGIQIRAAA